MNITRHARPGSALLVLLGLAASFCGLWLPLWRDRQYPAGFDTRIGFVVAGFAPMTTGCAALAAHGYFRLWSLQRTSPSRFGRLLLVSLALLAAASALTRICLAPTAVVMLPNFISSVAGAIFGEGAAACIFRNRRLLNALLVLLAITALVRRLVRGVRTVWRGSRPFDP